MNNAFERDKDGHICFSVKIANMPIEIRARNPYVYIYCREYLTAEPPVFSISVTRDEIRNEAVKSNHYSYLYRDYAGRESDQQIRKEINEGIIEFAIIHRKIAELSPAQNAIFMHGAVIAVGNNSFMFTARSGIGKTTHIKKWVENTKESFVVNGDKPFILLKPEGAFACGSPWCGKENYGTNAIVPLRSIVFMERSLGNHIERIPYKLVYMKLLEQTYHPTDTNQMKKTLDILKRLEDYISFYLFEFNNYLNDAFLTSYNCLVKQCST